MIKKMCALAVALAFAGFAGVASADSVIIDSNAHAGTITISSTGAVSVAAPNGTYDGDDDVVYNVVNSSSVVISGLVVTGSGIAGFDGDGIDNYVGSSGAGNGHFGTTYDGPYNNTGYEGYANNLGNIYSGYILGGDTVDVTFGGGGLTAGGGTGFISFEAPAGNGAINISSDSSPAPLPAPVLTCGVCLLGFAVMRKLLAKRLPPKIA